MEASIEPTIDRRRSWICSDQAGKLESWDQEVLRWAQI